MSQLPLIGDQLFTEREGVIYVAQQVNRARCIWRETPSVDVGIDGQIEYVNNKGQATGRMVFVQVKSGPSYFRGATEDTVAYYASAKHKGYWERSPVPIILILHNESTAETIWVDARDRLRDGQETILVPRINRLNPCSILNVLKANGPLPQDPVSMSELAGKTMAYRSISADLPLDFLDLFLHGLVNSCNSVYFGMDLVIDIAETKLSYSGSEYGPGLGGPEYQFLQDYVLFLTEQDLARVDFDEFNRDWDRGIVGRFMAPLTLRGRSFLAFLSLQDNAVGVRAVQDKIFRGVEPFECIQRVPVVENLKSILALL